MKGIIQLAAFVAMATAGPTFDHCTTMVDKIPEAINVSEVLGNWFYIRKGPLSNEMKMAGTFDCMTATMWKEYKGPENELNYLHHVRKDGNTHISKTTTLELQPAEMDGMHANNFPSSNSVQLPEGGEVHIDIQDKLVETDMGKSWSLWATCIQKDGANATIFWSVRSRFPYMDPFVEQMVVEKVEALGGLKASELRGFGQMHCH